MAASKKKGEITKIFRCPNCGKESLDYIFSDKKYECKECGYNENVTPFITTCPKCGNTITKYTWFDPSYCKKCNKSFVD